MNFRITFSISVKNEMGFSVDIVLNLQIAFDKMVTLTMLTQPMCEHKISFHFLKFLYLFLQRLNIFIVEALHFLNKTDF